MPNLPRTVDELTPQWITSSIRQRCPGVTVDSATIDRIVWGTATKVFFDLEYSLDSNPERPPSKICIKGEFDERVRAALAVTVTGTQVEALFYNDLAPKLDLPLPRHWFGGSEPGMGILIMENLAANGATFGTPISPWSPELVAKGLDILAKLHASTWGNDFSGIPWLHVGSPAVRQANEFLMSQAYWDAHFIKDNVFQMPAPLSDRERCISGLRAMWKYDDAHAESLIHGDAHVGNTCIDHAGNPFFIDWAGPCRSCWAFDVSNFMVSALSVDDRRATEEELLRHYLEKLQANGGRTLDWSDAWDNYRRHILNGIIWTTLPPTMQPAENVQALGERYTTAILDHDTLGLLGV
jgi:hypothetical protein